VSIKINESEPISISLPEDIWGQIPETTRQSEQDLSDYLLDALRIGVLATVNASITIDTARIEGLIDQMSQDTVAQHTALNSELETLLDANLTGDDSMLVRRLQETLGADGSLSALLANLAISLADPDHANSIPAKTKAVLHEEAELVRQTLNSAIDITDEQSNLGKFVREQRNRLTEVNEIVTTAMNALDQKLATRMQRIEEALGVDAAMQLKEAEIEELKDKSTGKGIHFENDAVEALQDIAGVFGDIVEHTGGSGEGATRSKVGDIVLIMNHTGLPPIRLAIEAKAGKISRKELLRQVREGNKNRNAVCGFGLMERKNMGARSFVVEQEAENYIVGVDWKDDNFLALEVLYRTIRIQLIADALRASEDIEIDVDALKKRIAQIKTDLGLFQSMKGSATNAIGVIEDLRTQLDTVERKVRSELKETEKLLE
jgi:hypothetical protein